MARAATNIPFLPYAIIIKARSRPPFPIMVISSSIVGVPTINIHRQYISLGEYKKFERPPPSKFQLKPPPGEKGHMHYERYWNRDSRFKPQFPLSYNDNLLTFIEDFKNHYELWPLLSLLSFLIVLTIFAGIYTTTKLELWIDRSRVTPPWDWSRIRDNYWKLTTILYDPSGATHQRLVLMEKLEDQMLEKAKERGTRNPNSGELVEK